MSTYARKVKALYAALVADTPVLLWGPPGTGKTATVEALGRHLGHTVVTVVGATRDRTDFSGWPVVTRTDEVAVRPFPWMRTLFEAGRDAILFLDELSATPEDVRPVLLRAINERQLGDFRYEGRVVAAANPGNQSVGGFDLEPPIANRLIHLDWEMDVAEWARGMREGFERISPELPPPPEAVVLEARTAEARALVAAYVERNPGRINQVPEGEQAGRAWPSFRSWDLAARFLGAARALGFDEEVIAEGVVGAVGSEAYGLLQFLRENDLPHPREVLEGQADLPQREDALFAVLMSLAAYVVHHPTPAYWERAWAILGGLADGGQADLAVRAAKRLAQLYIDLTRQGQGLPLPQEAERFLAIAAEIDRFAAS